MFKALYQKFSSLYHKQIDGTGLAIFRIVFSIVLLAEVLHLFYFRHLIFDKIPYLVPGEIKMWPLFMVWIAVLFLMIFGLFTRFASIANYLLTLIALGTISSYEYHMFYSYLTISFLFIFLPISRILSIDRLILKVKYSNLDFKYNPPQTVSVLSYYVIILLGIGFVYFDSVFFKLTSFLWTNGLGMWLPASMPQAVFTDMSPLLNIKYLIIGLGYLTFVFEALFLFTFFRRRWRIPILLIGVGLHIGILICFPIPLFALGVTGIYLLMVPVKWWSKIFSREILVDKIIKRFSEHNKGRAIPTLPIEDSKVNLAHNFTIEDLKIKAAFFGVIFLIILQCLVTYNTPLLKKARKDVGLSNLGIIKMSEKIAGNSANNSRIFLGITHHPVFMDAHFKGYNHSIAVIYRDSSGKETWLPICDKDGTPGDYISGFLWVKWTFRVNSALVSQENLQEGIRDFTAFWAHKHNVNLKDAVFLIKVKKNHYPNKWEHNFLRKQLANPWLDGGFVKWENNVFTPEIKEIEKI